MFNRRILFLFVCVFVFLCAVGAAFALTIKTKTSVTQMKVKIGQQFAISLRSNPTTGYGWQIAKPSDSRIVRLLGSKYKTGKTALVGSGGNEIWNCKAVGQGKTAITLKYSRPWEKGVPPVETHTYVIEVGKK